MKAYLDASAVIPLFVEEEGSRAAAEFIYRFEEDLIVSDFVALRNPSLATR